MSAEQAVLFADLPAGVVEHEAEPCCWAFPWREEADRFKRLWFDADQARLLYLWWLCVVLGTDGTEAAA